MSKLELEIHSRMNKKLGEYEIDIEPNAEDEPEHLYVVITDDNGDIYEGKISIKNKLRLLPDWATPRKHNKVALSGEMVTVKIVGDNYYE